MTQRYNTGEALTATEARSDTGTLLGSTMALIAVATGLFTLGAGRRQSPTSPMSIQRQSGKPAARRRYSWPDSGLQAMRGEETSRHSLGCSFGR